MINAIVLNGNEFNYHPKKNPEETRTGYLIWFTLEGCPYSFKKSFFREEEIAKAKAGVASGKLKFRIVPNSYVEPIFVLE